MFSAIKGHEVGAELGFYLGACVAWRRLDERSVEWRRLERSVELSLQEAVTAHWQQHSAMTPVTTTTEGWSLLKPTFLLPVE